MGTNDTGVITPREHATNADHHGEKVKEARLMRQWDREAHHRERQRVDLKRAEVAALIVISEALEKIALSR
jgi:hypothetical protein